MSSENDMELIQSRIEACIQDITSWMIQNKLKMNNGTSDIAVISSSYNPKPLINTLINTETKTKGKQANFAFCHNIQHSSSKHQIHNYGKLVSYPKPTKAQCYFPKTSNYLKQKAAITQDMLIRAKLIIK